MRERTESPASSPSSRTNPCRPCVGSYWGCGGDGKPLRVVSRMGGRTTSMLLRACCVVSALGVAQAFQIQPMPAQRTARPHAHRHTGTCSTHMRYFALSLAQSERVKVARRELCAQFQSKGSYLVRLALVQMLVCAPINVLPVAAASSLPLVPSSDEVLHEKTHKVQVFDEELSMLARQMFDAMYESGGIGLAGLSLARSLPLFRSLARLLSLALCQRDLCLSLSHKHTN